MDASSIIPVNIEDEMRGSYLDYAMSVIIGRALPDVRDGLKPVHRRILYAMLSEGLTSNKKFSKCAGVVGEVLKHYHPHGDGPVYSALVRMAQAWNLRYPLIHGQGNFGSVDGDAPAAYRYTECRMMALAEAILADIDKDTVDFIPNFDESTQEPVVLPSRVPNLLINGTEGIAVGMASKIPPHNLREIVSATIHVIENPECTVEELISLVPGPDFPTGGIIYGSQPIRQIYTMGHGLIHLRAKYHQETLKGGGKKDTEALIVDELPYQVNKAKLVEKIAELVNDKKIEGIARLRDESDRSGMRVVIELKRDAVPEVVMNQLFKLTALQQSFGAIMLAIVDGRPRVLSLKEALQYFVDHRRTVIVRRTRFELQKAKAREHILAGLRIALEHINEVIQVIKASESTPIARDQLQARFSLTEIQAQHILDMPLKRLTGLERKAIDDEYLEVTARIQTLTHILASPTEIDRIAIEELREVSEKFGDDRRTVIEADGEEIVLEDMIAEEDMIVTISHRGYAKRCSPTLYRAQRRGGKGVQGTKKLADEDGDFIADLFVASTHAHLLVFTTQGKLHWLKVYELPEGGRTARGRAIVNILKLAEDEKISTILPVRHFEAGKYVVMATRRGFIKRVDLLEFSNVRNGGIRATSLDEDDVLIGVSLTDGNQDCIISTKGGMAIRFAEDKVRVMGRTARGSRAITLEDGDKVVNLVTVPMSTSEDTATQDDESPGEAALSSSLLESNITSAPNEPASPENTSSAVCGDVTLLTVCENGYGKRTRVSQYRSQGRGGKGVIDIKTSDRNGSVVGTCQVEDKNEAMIVTTSGKVIRIPLNAISVIGRNTQGVRLINLEEGEKVAAVAKLADAAGDGGEGDTVMESDEAENAGDS